MALLCSVALMPVLIGQAHAHTIVSKTNTTPNITVGGIATYQVTVGSAGQSTDSTFLRVVDTLPPGFAYRSTQSIQFFNTSRFTTTAPTTPIYPNVGDTTPTWGRFDNPGTTGAYFVITFDADVINPTCANSVTNTAIVPNDPAPTTQHAVLTPAINQAPLNITGPPANLTATKSTSTPVVINTGAAGMTATYTIVVSNSVTKCAATGVNITDVLPPGFTYASTGAITFTGSPASAARPAGTDPVAGAANPTWTGFTIPGGGSVTLTFTANIAAGTANGTYYNSTNVIPAEAGAIVSNFGPGAPVTLASGSVTKQFGATNPANAQAGVVVPLTFTISKPAGAALAGIGFTDTLPGGMVVSGTPPTPQCGGSVSGSGGVITVSGANLAVAATSCTITLNVTAPAAGVYVNNSSNLTTVSPAPLVTAGANATLNVSNADLTKAFLTPVVGMNGTSVLRFTLTNAVSGAARGGLGFTDTLPANVSVVPGFAASQCNGGTVSSSGPQNISLSGASLAAGSTSCTVDVTVQGLAPGAYVNNASNISGLTGGLAATTANATLLVRGTVLEKNFSPANIGVGGTSILTFVINNGAGNPAQAGLAFTETLPANVTLSAVPATPQCGGAVAGAIGGNTITFSGGGLASGNSACSIGATVTSSVLGTYLNDSSRISGASAGMDVSGVNASLTVANVVLGKQFAASPVNPNTNVALVFTLTNSPGNPARSGLAFTDTFPAGVVVNGAAAFGAGCSGTVTNLAGNTGVSLTGGAMTAGTASCTITVQVQGTAGGTYINGSGNISGASSDLGTSGVNATLLVNGATLLVTKTTTTRAVSIIGAASGVATYTVTVQNIGIGIAAGVQVTDTLPAALTYASTTGIVLNGAATRTAVSDPAASSATPVWGTFSIPAGDSISITFNATIPNAQASGTYDNSASVTSSTAGTVSRNFNGATSTAEDVTVQRLADVTITKAQMTANPVQRGQTGVQYTLTVSNVGGAAKLAGNTVSVIEAPPTGLTVTAISGTNWSCALATLTCTRTDALAAGASYEPIAVTATVANGAPASFVNSSTVALAGQTESNTNNNTGNAAPTIVSASPLLGKSFAPNPVVTGQVSVLTFTITNGNSNPASTNLGFSDTLPSGLVIATPATVTNSCGGSVTAAAGAGVITLSGGALALGAAGCTVSVQVKSDVVGSYLNATANISGLTGGLLATGLTATLNVTALAPPSATKSFTPATIASGGTSSMVITVVNPNATSLTGVSINDVYTGTLLNNAAASVVCSAGGSATMTGGVNGGASVGFSAGTVAAGGTCTITQNVTATSTNNNTTTAPAATGPSAVTGVAASATLTVASPIRVTKSFSPDPVVDGNTNSTLTITLFNDNPVAATGVALTDTFPTGLRTRGGSSATTCVGGATTDTANATDPGIVTLAGATIPANGSCTVTVNVRGAAGASYTNTIAVGSVTSGNGIPANAVAATATLVVGDVKIDKAFSGGLTSSGTVNLVFTVTNFANSNQTFSFTDTLPSGLVVAAAVTRTCTGGTAPNPAVGASTIVVTNNVVAANAGTTCTITVPVKVSATPAFGSCPLAANTNGNSNFSNLTNARADVTDAAYGGGTVAPGDGACVAVVNAAPPVLTKAFSATNIALNGGANLTFTITNTTAGNVAISGLGWVDELPAGVTLGSATLGPNTCGAGVTLQSRATNGSGAFGAATTGSPSIQLSGAAVAANSICTVQVTVTGATAGARINGGANVTNLLGGLSNGVTAQTLNVYTPPTLTKVFAPASVAAGTPSTLTFTITNPAANPGSVSGITFADLLPASPGAMTVANATTTNTCSGSTWQGRTGAGAYAAPAAGNTELSLSGLTLASGASCTVSVNVSATVVGAYNNTSSTITATGPASLTGTAASASLTVSTALTPDLALTKTHTGNFVVGGTHAYTLAVSNTLGTAGTSGTITVTDTLPAGLTYVAATGTGWTCNAAGQVVTCTSTNVIAAGATSVNPITLDVLVAAAALPNVTNTATVSGGGEPAASNANNTASDYTVVVASRFLTDGAKTVAPGGTVFYTHEFIAGSAGTVSFSTADVLNPSIAGWSDVIYRDNNCNGVFDGAEGAVALAAAVPVSAGEQICIIVKSFAPAGAPNGAQNQITVTAAFTPSVGPPQSYTRTDLATVGVAATLTLLKEVRNVSTSGAFGTNNTALPGQTLEYRITYTNPGTGLLSNVVINDATPAFTTFLSAACGTLVANITACAAPATPGFGGSLAWTLTGTLASGAQSTVSYQVIVQP